ncbi:1-acyl-sn-glycerol-3-phosphate acyltransferase [Melittangium boletus]|uniref:lysophospholipid acyltransferase family protein n=1 Tax=Melittangium boletus TaxID=83453 RepID=UPI003DA53299
MAKGVLGNDPFQRGAAARSPESTTDKASGKAPVKKKDAGKKAAPPPARSEPPAKKTPPKAAAPKPEPKAKATRPKPEPKTKAAAKSAKPPPRDRKSPPPPAAVLAASAEMGIPAPAAEPVVEVVPAPQAGEAPAPAIESPAAEAVAVAEAVAEQATLLEEATRAGVADEALRELEESLGEPIAAPGSVDVPGFEAPPEPAPTHSASDIFFTSDSPGAEPPRVGDQMSGLLSLARDVAFQTFTSERLSRTVGSARGLVGATLTSLGLGTGSTAVDEYGKDASLANVLRPVLDFLYERYWRVSVQGASHVPAGPVLLVANHSGALPFDGPMLQQALSRERPDLQEARWLAEDQVFHAPMMGTLMNRLGAVRACPENALRLLDELRPVIVFPEGSQGMGKPFAQRYQLKRFGRGGFVKLALRTGAPIVPVAIVGAEETTPLLGRIPAGFLGLPYLPVTSPPLPVRWMLRFGEPIGMGELPPEAAEDMSQVQRLTERTRESIQGMLQALLKERRSVFAG